MALGDSDDPYILTGNKMRCPKCKSTDALHRNEQVLVSNNIRVNPDGTYDWSEEANDPCWDTLERNPTEPEFYCRSCGVYFEAPEVRHADEPEDKKSPRPEMTNLSPEEIDAKETSDRTICEARREIERLIGVIQWSMERPEQRWAYGTNPNPYLQTASHLVRYATSETHE